MSKWISVKERLPEEGQVVCVSDGKSTWDYGTFRGVFKANGQWYWKKRTMKTVKWWMLKSDALPEPPKEETLGEVPSHGRLIDADALIGRIEHDTPLSSTFEKVVRRYIEDAPTIIEAEVENE